MKKKFFFILILIFISLFFLFTYKNVSTNKFKESQISILDSPKKIPEIQLTNQNEQVFSNENFYNKWSILFFGYTFCPDICPLTLTQLNTLKKKLPKNIQKEIQFIFVTVDPFRDTAKQLKIYLNHFNSSFIGLTGSQDSIQQFTRTVGIPFFPPNTKEPNYLVTHSDLFVIIDPKGQHFGYISSPLNLESLTTDIPKIISTYTK